MKRVIETMVGLFFLVVFASSAEAITVDKSALKGGKVKVAGKGAAPLATILWEGSAVTTAKGNGKFAFSATVLPSDCVGNLSDGVTTIQVGVGGCTTTGAGGGGEVAATGQTTCYDSVGAVISCAGTGQDGDVLAGTPLPSPRFTDNGNGTITDNLTKLIWLKDANCFGARTWSQALTDANTLADGACSLTDGSTAGDWHLPNRNELASLINLEFVQPSLSNTAGTAKWTNGDAFNNVQLSVYWSSTTLADGPSGAWDVLFFGGTVSAGNKPAGLFVLPVRSGP